MRINCIYRKSVDYSAESENPNLYWPRLIRIIEFDERGGIFILVLYGIMNVQQFICNEYGTNWCSIKQLTIITELNLA